MTRSQQLTTIVLVILALTGVQVLQNSALHGHLVHVADCTLCHHDSTESVPVTVLPDTPAIPQFAALPEPCTTRSPLPFSSRAPPNALS